MELSDQLYATGIDPGTYFIGGWVGHRVDLDAVEKKKITPAGIRTWAVQHVARRCTKWLIGI
jgi:hypothetical protein